MGHRKWSEIRASAAPETLEAAARKKERFEAAIELRELARARGLTQEALAERLERAQGNVSRMLRRSDMHVSTLREVIEAMGGELRVLAQFPDGKAYPIAQFDS